METQTNETRSIRSIAYDIKRDWKKVYFAAVPYLNAMCELNTINDRYGLEDAESVIIYFLSNASSYKGENAKKYKAELKQIAGIK